LHAEKKPSALQGRTTTLDILLHGFTYLLGERETHLVAGLPRHAKASLWPVNVVQIHGDDVPCPEAEPRQQEDPSTVPEPHRGAPIAGSDDAFDIGGWQVLEQS
jgi:hypothetical protein